jgi:hypothetical protein
MTDSSPRQEIVVTDVRMRFGSMVVFMVKWAIASIPALLILLLIGALFSGLAISFFSSLGSIGAKSRATSAPTLAASEPASASSEETAYLPKVLVKNISVGQGALGDTGVFGEVKNSGDRSLKEVEVTVLCLDKEGKPIFEKKYHPVLVSDFAIGTDNTALKPGYSRQFGVKLSDAPSDWSRKVDVKVTKVAFQ